jgi:UDP-N-acetylglucosamine diphosphorylase / glucose-1-phosphate thymidylyltransferase / UDP-N-acetylgalactosamine diphosphorylase / glucosamine-1-phosphate N-acetyltransferase / galactosamine-1-phosphate N-acetyltransferase
MKELSAENFFDLSSYQHAALFKNQRFVWEALSQIKNYFNTWKFGLLEANISEGAFLIDAHLISIGKGSIIEPGAYVKGPCIIGKNCTIRHGAYIRGGLITGDHCVIGHETEIKNAILLDHVHAAHFAYVGDTILGNHVNLGAGTKCANLKFDRQPITVQFQGKKLETGLKKLGAILGDEVQTGCNVVTNPGTLIGKGAYCSAVMSVRGVIPAHSFVKTNVEQIIEPRTSLYP